MNDTTKMIEQAIIDKYGYDPIKELNNLVDDMGKEDLRKLLFVASNAIGNQTIPNPTDAEECAFRLCDGIHTLITNYKSAKMEVDATVPVGYA